jgi:predicted MFS family arabinose efflux permease
MSTNNLHQKVLASRLQRVLVAFFLLATLFLLVVYFVTPSIYTDTLMLQSTPADRYPLAATLFLVGIVVFIAILVVGVVRHWRWLFWLLLIAFTAMILEIPATILQLTGVIASLFPVWYSLCRMGVSLIAVGIAGWMWYIYRHYGVWGRGK